MTLVAGLGNPTQRYKNNRHNIGFMVVDSLIDDLKPSKINKNQFFAELYKSSQILLLKPLTYMNNSGQSISAVMNYYKCDKLIVVHDDLEIPFGSVRIKHGGGNGGHNGLKSIDSLYGRDYDRIRIGIGRPENKQSVSDYVLNDFDDSQKKCLPIIVKHANEAVIYLVEHSVEEAASKFTSRKSLCN